MDNRANQIVIYYNEEGKAEGTGAKRERGYAKKV
jgi:hypothetical protein